MKNVEIHIGTSEGLHRVGTLFRYARQGGEVVAFEYHEDWLALRHSFPLEPALPLSRGLFRPAEGHTMFGSLGDSAPDSWGRRLLQRAERRRAEHEGRASRTLAEADFVLGVSDVVRQGALRFRGTGNAVFEKTHAVQNVPRATQLSRLIRMMERICGEEEVGNDLDEVLAFGASLGGSRPKTSVVESDRRLSIAKFPSPDDDFSVERWEAVALQLAKMAGVAVADHQLLEIDGQLVLLSRRFDRDGSRRIPFLSALSLMGLKDGERGSYPELADVVARHCACPSRDAIELYRRMVLNVLISNVDDHLRNQGFLWHADGWSLSPAYDLNPTPVDVKAHILSTNIDLEAGICDLDRVLSVAELFNLKAADARMIIKTIAEATCHWREVASSLGARAAEIRRMESAFEHHRAAQAARL